MEKRSTNLAWLLRLIGLVMIAGAGVLGLYQFRLFSDLRPVYPPGSQIGGIAVGGVDSQTALNRLLQAYGIPVELHYSGAVIHAQPADLGLELDLTAMLTDAELQRRGGFGWDAFWKSLWDQKIEAVEVKVDLRASVDESRLRAYLQKEIMPRYDQTAQPAQPVPGTTRFISGKAGTALDIEAALPKIRTALLSPSLRTVELSSRPTTPPRPIGQVLQVLLGQVISVSGFDGVSEIYLHDLKNDQIVHFAYQKGRLLPANIGFTAASTIKIPIMISTFRRVKEPAPKEILDKLAKMIEISENDPADWLMQNVMDKNTGPLEVTADLQAMGFKNTFLAGYFYPGAALLRRFSTPASQRTDITTDPDPYNQTVPAEIGVLLEAIYNCAEGRPNLFERVFPGEISPTECKMMVQFLLMNKLPVLVAAGVPEGTPIAHKHGWIQELDGLVHTFSDVAIVYSPGGDYVVTAYLWSKSQLLFDAANSLMADLSRAIYNYINLDLTEGAQN